MTLCECAKFLIRLARQPEAAAALWQSLYDLSAFTAQQAALLLWRQCRLCTMSCGRPCTLALFACVGRDGRLDLWTSTRHRGGSRRRTRRAGRGRRRLLSVSPSQKRPFFDRPLNCSCAADSPILRCSAGNWQMHLAPNHLISLHP